MEIRAIQINAHGGLGNQFFAYFAGLYLAKKLDCPLNLYLGKCDRQHADAKYDISSFDLDLNGGKMVNPKLIDHDNLRYVRKMRDSAIYRSKLLQHIQKKYLRHFIEGRDFDHLWAISPKAGDIIEGYFSTFKYYEFLKTISEIGTLQLINPSVEFIKQTKRYEGSYIALHLRRGDMRNFKNTAGNLSFQYYQKAVEEIFEKTGKQLVLIFSDDISEATELKKRLGIRDSEVVQNLDNPAENFLLLSRANAHVIANSSFSAWSSLLSNTSKMIIAPYPYLRQGSWPDVWPTRWNKSASEWEL